MPKKWADIKFANISPERAARILRESQEALGKIQQPPFTYDWKPGDRGCLGFPEQHGLDDGLVDVRQVEETRLLVDDGQQRAWVPRELVGKPEDFGVIDDSAYFASRD